MNYRIARKIIKRSPSVRLWIESFESWIQIAVDSLADRDRYGVALKYICYDREMMYRAAKKLGIKPSQVNHYDYEGFVIGRNFKIKTNH